MRTLAALITLSFLLFTYACDDAYGLDAREQTTPAFVPGLRCSHEAVKFAQSIPGGRLVPCPIQRPLSGSEFRAEGVRYPAG